MRTIEIFHPIDGKINHDNDMNVKYHKVAEVKATNIYDAFQQAQNDFNPDYAKHEVRSTCVGDIIRDCETDETIILCGIGENHLTKDQWINMDDAPTAEDCYNGDETDKIQH